jgi:UDP-N-acetylmuramoyl-tripeptide--D-alanyl-D-alanine ligase
MTQEQLEQLYDYFLAIGNVTTDTRQCRPNSMFFALKGDRFDGNTFIKQALAQGCSLAVSDNIQNKGIEGVFVVDDVLIALQTLAKYHRKMLGIPIIGITGTNGKTTTKELVAAVLAQKFNIKFTQGNLNNHIGVPLTLLAMDNSTEIGVVEMGANHIGEIEQLCNICQPDFGIITNIGRAHLEGFGSYEGVVKAKSELYDFIDSKAGQLFINCDDELLVQLSRGMNTLYYGGGSKVASTIKAANIVSAPHLAFKLIECGNKEETEIKSQLIGAYNIDNILAACCVGIYFGIPTTSIKNALEQYTPNNNRSQLVLTQHNHVLMDAYNANPSSMKAAIENFAFINHHNKLVIIGGMRELGSESQAEHLKIISLLVEKDFSKVILIGNEFAGLPKPKNYQSFNNAPELIEHLKNNPIQDHFIMVKGSRGNQLEQLQAYL